MSADTTLTCRDCGQAFIFTSEMGGVIDTLRNSQFARRLNNDYGLLANMVWDHLARSRLHLSTTQ